MIKPKLALAASLIAAFAVVGCGSSGSNNGSSSSGIFCDVSSAGTQACAGSTTIPAADQQSYKNQCTQGGGKIVSACPTSGLIGCCTEKGSGGYSVESCVYGVASDAGGMGDAGVMANAQKQACQSGGGTWSTSP